MFQRLQPFNIAFYRTEQGREPVYDWIKSLQREERRIIGHDLRTLQFGWPLGMPLVRPMSLKLWEMRSNLQNKISRVFFTIHDGQIILLHAFVKKTQKTDSNDLALAKRRLKEIVRVP